VLDSLTHGNSHLFMSSNILQHGWQSAQIDAQNAMVKPVALVINLLYFKALHKLLQVTPY